MRHSHFPRRPARHGRHHAVRPDRRPGGADFQEGAERGLRHPRGLRSESRPGGGQGCGRSRPEIRRSPDLRQQSHCADHRKPSPGWCGNPFPLVLLKNPVPRRIRIVTSAAGLLAIITFFDSLEPPGFPGGSSFRLYFVSRFTVFPLISSPETMIRSTRVVLGCSIRLISRSAAILPKASVFWR